MGRTLFVFQNDFLELSGKKNDQQWKKEHGGENGKTHDPHVIRHQPEHDIPEQRVVQKDVECVPTGVAAGLEEDLPLARFFQQSEEGAANEAHEQGGDDNTQRGGD